MARNTIGQFISALRKSNGMTQKQLAEMLNVSDKAVSRWERDECAPDLSLIPVIADIFGVTSDEILRGERTPQFSDETNITNAKSEKQIKHLIDGAQTKFTVRSIISVGIGLFGLMVAMICNFGFLRAHIGFFVGCIFYLAAVICEVIFTKLAFFSVDSDDFDDEKINQCKQRFFRVSALTCSVILVLFTATLPLIVFTDDPYVGLLISSWAGYGFLFGIVGALISAVAFIIAKNIVNNRNLYNFKQELTPEVLKLRKRCIAVLAVIIGVTVIAQLAFNQYVPNRLLSGCSVYTDINKFVEFIETPSYVPTNEVTMPMINYDMTVMEEENSLGEVVPREKEELVEYIYAEDGETVICSYVQRNNDVSEIDVEWNDGAPTIYVYTNNDLQRANHNFVMINVIFLVSYVGEVVIVGIIYYRKKKQLLSK